MRIDISTFKRTGGLRMPGSIHEDTGLRSMEVDNIDTFQKEDARIPGIAKEAALEEYEEKRDFEKTKEPTPNEERAIQDGDRFVVQKHDASKLHYDFRLEADGVLKSWAVPNMDKIATEEKGKVLAVETEDHPVDYIDFSGEIPENEYGGGTVEIWDSGSYKTLEHEGDKWTFSLDGKKLKGKFTLLKPKSSDDWLFVRGKNE